MAGRLSRHGPTIAALVVSAAVLLAGCGGGSSGPNSSTGGLAVRKVTISGLVVTVTPKHLDTTGAEFTVAFDTHTGAPGIDVAARSVLVVDGTRWVNPTWSGDSPGGHHRSGTLRFNAAGPASGAARLSIDGLDQPVDVTWDL